MTDDIAICDACRSGDCDDCAGRVVLCVRCGDGVCDNSEGSAWCDEISFGHPCDCLASGHSLQRDIAEDEAADRALTAHYEERP